MLILGWLKSHRKASVSMITSLVITPIMTPARIYWMLHCRRTGHTIVLKVNYLYIANAEKLHAEGNAV